MITHSDTADHRSHWFCGIWNSLSYEKISICLWQQLVVLLSWMVFLLGKGLLGRGFSAIITG